MFLKVEALPYIQIVPLSISQLKPEEKVNLAIQMTDMCVRICADAVKDRYAGIKDEELIELSEKESAVGNYINVKFKNWRLLKNQSEE